MVGIHLGIPDVRPLPGIAADPHGWANLHARMHRRVFLRSEGAAVEVGAPQVVSGALLAGCTELVERVNRFYAGATAAYYTHPSLRSEYLVNPLIEPLLELEADQQIAATPLSRLDAVLGPDGRIRMIELNPVGVTLFHLRNLLYLIRELDRGGFAEDARRLDTLARDTVVRGFLRFAAVRAGALPKRPVVGALTRPGFFRAAQRLFRAAFERAGCDYVEGDWDHLATTAFDIRLRGTRVDILWADFFFYGAYQCERLQQTTWPNKTAEFRQTPAQAVELLANRHFLEHLRAGRVVNISPARSYLALPKSLLAWIHRADRPVPEADRAFLAEHVARTYSARDRADGLVSLDEVVKERGDFILKPCQQGGGHGVEIGRMCDAAVWRQHVTAIWDDPTWVVQAFHEPAKAANGEWISLGIPNLDGELGGVYFRTSRSLLISARVAGFVAAVAG